MSVENNRKMMRAGFRLEILKIKIYLKNNNTPLVVYRKGDIVKQPMKKDSFVPKNVPGVGWGGVG